MCAEASVRPCEHSAPGICLKGRGASEAIPQQLQSGYRALLKRFGRGGYWRLEMLRLVLGYGNACGVALGPESREGGLSPPPPPSSSDSLLCPLAFSTVLCKQAVKRQR